MARAADDDAEATYQVQFKGEDKQHGVLSKNGVARAVFPNGDVYEGEYAHGKRNGRGVYTFKKGGRYEGTYADNKKDGEGTLTAPDGSRYVGQWKNDKRHGTGTYYYANGDRYIGGWRNGQKHGHGTYLYAKVQCQLAADWSNGHAQNGVWTSHDGTKYTGAFLSNTPNGAGVFQFANGNSETGKFEVKQMPVSDDAPDDEEKKTTFQWVKDEAERVLPDAAPPAVADVEPLKRACRAIDKAVLKLDHFEAIYRLEKKFEGVPNFRKVDAAAGAAAAQSYAIYGSGQPSVSGFQLVLSDILSGGGGGANAAGEGEDITKVVWMNMRQEPVIYVNNMSYAPRDLKALNENMEFPGVDQHMLLTLEQRMAEALRKKVFAAGGIHTFYKDTFAENPADRKNLVLTEDVPRNALDQAIRPITAVYNDLRDSKNLEVQYVRLPIVDERSPTPADFDHLVDTLKGPVAEPQTALYFNCQMGKGRTTTGMVCAVLMKRVIDPNNKEPEPADYNDASPDLALGQYKVIMRLVEALSKGAPEPKPDAANAAAAAAAGTAAAPAASVAAPAAAAGAAAPAAGAAADGKSAPAPAAAAAAPADGAAAAPAAAVADASAAAAAAPAADVKSADGAAAAGAGAGVAGASSASASASASTAHKENGELVKAEVDDAMDKCRAMQHLRTCIVEARDKALKEEKAGQPERRAFWKRMGQNFLERYFFLICFNAYLRDAGRPKRPEKKKKLKPQPQPQPQQAAAVVVSPPSPTDADAKAAEAKGKAKAAAKKKRRGADDDDDDDGAEEDDADADADADAEAAAEAEEERKRAAAEAEAERKAQEEAEEAEEAARDEERWEELKANFVPFSAITFSKWLNERPHLTAILGTRQSGALADFNWT